MSNPYPPGQPGPGGAQPPQGGGYPPQGGYPPPGQPPAGPPPGQGPQWQPGPGPQGPPPGPPQGPPQGPPPGPPPGQGGGGPYGPPPGGQPPYGPGPQQGNGGGGKRGLVIGLAVVLVAVLGGGVAFGITWLRGGGPQPAEVLPGDAIGYMRFDQSPSGDQQLKAYNFIKNFPDLADEILGEEGDPIFQQALESAQKDDECKGVDYAEDVEPWLGDALGFAVLPTSGDEEPKVAGAIEASNEEDSIAGMKKLVKACDGKENDAGYAYRDGFLIVANTQGEADDYAATEETLADNENFKSDMDALGEEGILSFWMDLGEVMKMSGASAEEAEQMGVDVNKIADGAGRLTGALRFDDRYVELTGSVSGADAVTEIEGGTTKVAELPDSTVAALAFSGGREGFNSMYGELEKQLPPEVLQQVEGQLAAFEQDFGLTLPEDLATLFGDQFALAVDETALDTLMGMGAMGLNGGDTFGRAALDVENGTVRHGIVPMESPLDAYPGIGIRIDAEEIDGVKDVVGKITEAVAAMSGTPIELPQASSDSTLTVATDQGYADKLLEAGALGEDETFQLAVPDADNAQSVFYINLQKIVSKVPAEAKAEAGDSLDALGAFGVSGTTSEGGGSFTVRLVAN